MKALTLWQPWASLIIAGAKPYEFRSWPAPVSLIGQRIAIHAGARTVKPDEVRALLLGMRASQCSEHPRRHSGLRTEIAVPILEGTMARLPLSSILGTAILGEPTKNPIVDGHHLVADSDRTDHLNWGWPLTDIERFEPPIPARGAQGLWNWNG
jgi:hypothetical protein